MSRMSLMLLAVTTVCLAVMANGIRQPRLFFIEYDDDFESSAPMTPYFRRWAPATDQQPRQVALPDMIQVSKKDSPMISCGLTFVRRVDKVCKGCSKGANKQEITKRSFGFRPKRDADITVQCCLKGCTDADLKQLCCTS